MCFKFLLPELLTCSTKCCICLTVNRTYVLSRVSHVTCFHSYSICLGSVTSNHKNGLTGAKLAVGTDSPSGSTGPSILFSLPMEGSHIGHSWEFVRWGPTITNSQHGGCQSRYGKIFAVHASIKHTFQGLRCVYDTIACLHLLNTAIWFTSWMVGKKTAGWWWFTIGNYHHTIL